MALLKRDVFGSVLRIDDEHGPHCVRRELRGSPWWARALAAHLLRREARALRHLHGLSGVPTLLRTEPQALERAFIPGEPMHLAKPRDPAYFRAALTLLRRLHARNLSHNDLAKETNWLVTTDGAPALVDFQLARFDERRGRLFRLLAHDDLRHLLKHKRSYLPESLSARERRILASPSIVSRLWRMSGKRVYRFVTRGVLGWSDREGAGDRALRDER
jgi:RIO-like serine/threonine protein kinase